MKHLFLVMLVGLGLSSFFNEARAQRLEGALSTGYMGYSKDSSQFDIGPGFYYQPLPSMAWLQLGGEITYQKITERGGSTRNTLIMGGPIFNLSGAVLSDAFFLSIGLAYKSGASDVIDGTTEDPNGFGYYLLFGRRITLGTSSWSLRPTIGMVNTGTSGVVFRPFAVSYRF